MEKADAHRSIDPWPAKTGGGEQRAHVTPSSDAKFRPCMPVGERADRRVTWNSVFHIAKGIAGKVGHHSHHHIPSVDLNSNNNNNNNNNNRREFDEEEFDLRDFDEDLEAREPIDVEKVLHRAHRVYRAAQYIPTGNYNDRRDLVEEVFEREFDDEELLEREYYDDLD